MEDGRKRVDLTMPMGVLCLAALYASRRCTSLSISWLNL